MEHKKFEDITAAEAEKMVDDIWNRLTEFGLVSKGDNVLQFDHVVPCYYLWTMKNDSSIKTPEDILDEFSKRYDYYYFEDPSDLFTDVTPDSWTRFRSILDDYTLDELSACVLKSDYGFNEHEDTPDSIINLADALLEISDKDVVIDANSYTGKFSIKSAIEVGKGTYKNVLRHELIAESISGIVQSTVMKLDKISFSPGFDGGNKAFVDVFNVPGKREPIDSYYSVWECWKDYPQDNEEIPQVWSMCAIAIAETGFDGRTVAVMTAGELAGTLKESHRKFLVDSGYIEGVIALPEKMYSSTWINSYMVIFDKGSDKIRFLDARDIFVSERIKGKRVNVFNKDMVKEICDKYNDDTQVSIVTAKEIAENEYNLNPVRYTTIEPDKVNAVELGKLIHDVSRGITLKASEMDEYISNELSPELSNMRCIRPFQIKDGVLAGWEYYHGDLHRKMNQCISGNILLSKNGNPFKVAVANNWESCLVIGNLYIISVKSDKVSPAYIKCFLSSSKGQEEIRRLAVGTATPMLRISDVKKIRIPIYDDDKQKEMEKKAETLVKELEIHHKELSNDEDELARMFDEE